MCRKSPELELDWEIMWAMDRRDNGAEHGEERPAGLPADDLPKTAALVGAGGLVDVEIHRSIAATRQFSYFRRGGGS